MLSARSWLLLCLVVSMGTLAGGGTGCDWLPRQEGAQQRPTAAQTCEELKRKVADLKEKRREVDARRQQLSGRLGELEATLRHLNRFAPRLRATLLHVYPNEGPPPREISGHIRNGTNEEVRVMHLRAKLVPEEGSEEPIVRDVEYRLRESLGAGEVQHAPYGQQILDAYPDVEADLWRESELELDVTALEGPDGEVLWDRRGDDRESLENALRGLDEEMEGLDQRLAERRAQLADCTQRDG